MLTEVKNQLRVWALSIKYSIIRSMANKKSFLFSVLLMFISNASFLVQWVVILGVSSNVDLTMREIMLVWGFCASAFGLSNILFGGVHFLPTYIIEGKLDAYMVQPKNILLSIASSHSSMSAFGDVLYGLVIVLFASPNIKTFILYILFSLLGSICYAAFIVIVYSCIFFSINFRELTGVLVRISVSFGTYPENIFSSKIKLLLYTLIPLGAMVYMPTRVISETNYYLIFLILGYTVLITILAFIIFYKGIKKYSSSNLMSSRV